MGYAGRQPVTKQPADFLSCESSITGLQIVACGVSMVEVGRQVTFVKSLSHKGITFIN